MLLSSKRSNLLPSMTSYSFVFPSRERQWRVSFLPKRITPVPCPIWDPNVLHVSNLKIHSPLTYRRETRACARAHPHSHKNKNGQMLSPPRLSTSTLRSVAEVASLPLETGPPCATWSFGASATIHLAQIWDWTPRSTRTRLLHDVAAKPAVLSTPVNE